MEGERFSNDNDILRPDATKITSIHNNRPELVTCGHLTSRGEQTSSSYAIGREKWDHLIMAYLVMVWNGVVFTSLPSSKKLL